VDLAPCLGGITYEHAQLVDLAHKEENCLLATAGA